MSKATLKVKDKNGNWADVSGISIKTHGDSIKMWAWGYNLYTKENPVAGDPILRAEGYHGDGSISVLPDASIISVDDVSTRIIVNNDLYKLRESDTPVTINGNTLYAWKWTDGADIEYYVYTTTANPSTNDTAISFMYSNPPIAVYSINAVDNNTINVGSYIFTRDSSSDVILPGSTPHTLLCWDNTSSDLSDKPTFTVTFNTPAVNGQVLVPQNLDIYDYIKIGIDPNTISTITEEPQLTFSYSGNTESVMRNSQRDVIVPSGTITLEPNKAATIDVSQYSAPVEVTPTAGKDGMEKVTVTLDNIPLSNPLLMSETLYRKITTTEWTQNWSPKTWTGLTTFNKSDMWSDGTDIYYSNKADQYVLDKATNVWEPVTWNGLNNFYGTYIWTNGIDTFYSKDTNQYKLNKATKTWEPKSWSGYPPSNFDGRYVWTDGTNIYYSTGSNQYWLDVANGNTWYLKTWNGLTSFSSLNIWTDGTNIYCGEGTSSVGSRQYVLDKATSTWSQKTWSAIPNLYGRYIWTDGINVYYSSGSSHFILDKATGIWSRISWIGLLSFDGNNVWTDGNDIYYSNDTAQYILDKKVIYEPVSP